MKIAIATAALTLAALTGCSAGAAPTAARPATPSPHAPAARSPSPAVSGFDARVLVTECAAQIEVDTAGGHDYTGLPPHSHELPRTCWALSLSQLTKAAGRAFKDMLHQ